MLFVAALAALQIGCSAEDPKPAGRATPKRTPREVIVYTALDRQFSEPILKDFEDKTGIRVRPVFDTEAVKTVGLVNQLTNFRSEGFAQKAVAGRIGRPV